jgi:hypothetical protein
MKNLYAAMAELCNPGTATYNARLPRAEEIVRNPPDLPPLRNATPSCIVRAPNDLEREVEP